MLVPKYSDVEGQLQWIVDMHYTGDDMPYGSPVLTPCLPGMGPDLQTVVEFITDRLWQAGAQLTSRPRALAEISTFLSGYLHREYCVRAARPDRRRACARDVSAVTDLVSMIASPFLEVELDAPLKAVAMDALTAVGLEETQVDDAMEAVFQRITHPAWGSRKLLPVSAANPIIQINSAISHISAREYYRVRTIALVLRAELMRQGYQVEVTSDYAAPRASPTCSPNEILTRAAIYRTAGMICIADHGRLGTGTTLTLAGELLIPTLVLYQDPADLDCARYPSGLARRMTSPYGDADDAVRAVAAFLKTMNDLILARARQLEAWSSDDITEVQDRFATTEVAAFDLSPVTFDRAQMFASDSIVWNQCPTQTRGEIARILGIRASPDTTPQRRSQTQDAAPTAVSSLLVAAAYKDWRPSRVSAVYEAYLLAHDRSLSTRRSSWGFEDWIRFEATLP